MNQNNPKNPDYKNPEYLQRQPEWKIVVDVVEGTLRLRKECADYLPPFPAEPKDAYARRKNTSILFNGTAKTLTGLVGLAFQKEPSLGDDVPEQITMLLNNADLKNNAWDVFAKEVLYYSIQYGKGYILTDMQKVKPAATLESQPQATAQDQQKARPYWTFYRRDQVLNKRTKIVDGKTVISQITFEEISQEPFEEFGEVTVKRYRSFRLNDDGTVEWRLFKLTDEGRNKQRFEVEGGDVLEGFTEIPVAQVLNYDPPPLLDLATLNIKHFQQRSDYDVSLHIGAIEILWAIGRDKDSEIQAIGHSFLVDISDGGTLQYASPTGACIAANRTNLEDLKVEMSLLGLSFVAERQAIQRTATEASQDDLQETSELATIVRGLKDALEQSLNYMAQFLGIQLQNKMTVNLTPGADLTLSADDVRVLSDLAFRNQISLETLWSKLQAGKILQSDFDPKLEQEQLNKVQPAGNPLPIAKPATQNFG